MICKKGQKKHLIKFTDDAKLGDVKSVREDRYLKKVEICEKLAKWNLDCKKFNWTC